VKPPGRKPRARSEKKKKLPRFIPVGDRLQCRFLDNAWHLITLKPLPTPPYRGGLPRDVDILLNRRAAEIIPGDARRHYGAEVYAVAKRRLAKRELRQYPIPMDLWE
jgi:hypothetical protein